MSITSHRMALMGLALAAMGAPAEYERAQRPEPPTPRQTPGNSSGHTPHQGKREMERRRKRMDKKHD
jgi:hypothetical protein